MLTGLGPWRHGVRRPLDRLAGTSTLVEDLAAAGYTTAGFRGSTALRPGTGFDRGLAAWPKLRDGEEARAALAGLEPGRLVWLHLTVPTPSARELRAATGRPADRSDGGGRAAPRLALGAGRPLDAAQRAALATIHRRHLAALDRGLAPLLDALEASPGGGDALVALVGVSGLALGENDLIGDGRDLERPSIETALALRVPRAMRERIRARREDTISTARLHATLLEAAGLAALPGTAPSLWRAGAQDGALSELYQERWFNQFSWIREGGQLLWTTPLRDPQRATRRSTARAVVAWNQTFFRTPPLSGSGAADRAPRRAWRDWGEVAAKGNGNEDRGRGREGDLEADAMARELRREFLRFVGEERPLDPASARGEPPRAGETR